MSNMIKMLMLLLLVAVFAYLLVDLRTMSEPAVGQNRPVLDIKKLHPKLEAIYLADQIKDPVERCLNYPDLDGVKWPQELLDQMCRRLANIWDEREYRRLLDSENYDVVDQQITKSIREYLKGNAIESTAYEYFWAFAHDNDWTRETSDKWLKAAPQSANAMTARAYYLSAAAEMIRQGRALHGLGDDREIFYEKITQSNLLLHEAIKINRELLPAYSERIDNALYESNDNAKIFFDRGLLVDPDSFHLRADYIHRLQPHWYGSIEEMEQFIDQSLAHAVKNPSLLALRNRPYAALGQRKWINDEAEEALSLFDEGLKLGPSVWLLQTSAEVDKELGNQVRAFERLSQISRYQRGDAKYDIDRALMLANFIEYQWAEQVLRDVIRRFPDSERAFSNLGWLFKKDSRYAEALEMYQKTLEINPDSLYAHKEISWVSLYRLRNLELAKPHIDAILELDPENYHGWLYMADYLHDSGGEPLLIAIRNFLKYVDREDPDMQSSIVAVENYLNSHVESK